MLFPIIRIKYADGEPRIVGTNIHDVLKIDEKSGGIQYESLQCVEGTDRSFGEENAQFSFVGHTDGCLGHVVEFVTFEELCELYIQQTIKSVEGEKKLYETMREIKRKHDDIIKNAKLDDNFRNTGGTLL